MHRTRWLNDNLRYRHYTHPPMQPGQCIMKERPASEGRGCDEAPPPLLCAGLATLFRPAASSNDKQKLFHYFLVDANCALEP